MIAASPMLKRPAKNGLPWCSDLSAAPTRRATTTPTPTAISPAAGATATCAETAQDCIPAGALLGGISRAVASADYTPPTASATASATSSPGTTTKTSEAPNTRLDADLEYLEEFDMAPVRQSGRRDGGARAESVEPVEELDVRVVKKETRVKKEKRDDVGKVKKRIKKEKHDEDEPKDEVEKRVKKEKRDEGEPRDKLEAPTVVDAEQAEEEEKADQTESEEEAEEELDLGDESDFKKGPAFAAAFAELAKVLVAGDPDEENPIEVDPVAFAAASKSMRILCKQGRIVVTGGYTPPGPPPKKKKRSMSTAAYRKKGVALIGSAVKLMWPDDGETYGGLILGYQSEDDVHKVYFWCDGSVALLSRRDVTFVPDTDHKLRGLVGMRVYRITKNKTNEPEEAFVVRKFSDKCYQLLYTDDERVRKSNMLQTSSEWGLLEKGELHVNCNPITTWSDY